MTVKKAQPQPLVERQASEQITAEQAKQAIEAERQARIRACGEAINRVLQEHRCALDATITLSGRGIQPQIAIVAAE